MAARNCVARHLGAGGMVGDAAVSRERGDRRHARIRLAGSTVMQRRFRARMRRIEQERALERERARIARDMHDELGASLTRITLMSELAAREPVFHPLPADSSVP